MSYNLKTDYVSVFGWIHLQIIRSKNKTRSHKYQLGWKFSNRDYMSINSLNSIELKIELIENFISSQRGRSNCWSTIENTRGQIT